MEKLYKLQNGTDIRGVAFKDENSDLDITLSKEDVKIISYGFATWLKNKTGKDNITISLGRDSRVTGSEFISACSKNLIKMGVNVVNCEMATTPSMFMSTIMDGYKADGAIMFTASHMPYIYNGMKMFTSNGCLEKSELKEVLDICVSNQIVYSQKEGTLVCKNLIDDYADLLSDKIRSGVNSKKNYEKPLTGMKIIVDAGNGSGGFYAEKVLKNLGADIEGSQFLDPDGMFPNHIPNPENKDAMDSISKATVKSNADLGIIFDTDVDRAAIVASNGKEINKNALIALISKIVLTEYPNSTIVTDSVTSNGLAKFITENGGIHHRFMRGYKNVINEAIRLNNEGVESHLAIETSGHAAIKENYFLDDGAYLVSKILIKAASMFEEGKNIVDLISGLEEALESCEKRIKINKKDFKSYGQSILKDLKEYASTVSDWEEVIPNYEGIRYNCKKEDGWFLLRMSLHEPLLVLNIESNVKSGIEKVRDKVISFLENYDLSF